MAKSYTIKEATEILMDGTDVDEVAALYKHAPLLSYSITRLVTVAPAEFTAFVECLPEYLTTTKVNVALRKAAAAERDSNSNTVGSAAPVATTTTGECDAPATTGGTDYDSMSSTDIKALIDERGLRDLCREKFGNARKPNAIKLLKAIDAGEIDVPTTSDAGTAAATAEVEDTTDSEAEAGAYDGIAAPELYKLCKERGIKAAVKKPARYYVDLLVANDLENASNAAFDEAASDDDDDDWDDDDSKPEAPSESPAIEEDEEDDDDWDI